MDIVNKMNQDSGSLPPSRKSDLIATTAEDGVYFFFDEIALDSAGLHVVCGGRERCGESYEVCRSGFPYFGLEFVACGTGRLRLDGEEYALHGGHVFLYRPGQPHQIVTSGEEPMIKYFIDLAGQEVKSLLQEYPLHQSVQIPPDPVRYQQYFDNLIHSGRSRHRYAREVCRHLAQVLIMEAAAGCEFQPEQTHGHGWLTFLRCRQFVEENYLAIRSLDDLAAKVHLSKVHLCRLFSRYTGNSPYQYLIELKMSHAASLIMRTSESIREVAERCGYEDPYHFSRVFKKVYGVSPTAFRNSFTDSG